MKVIDDHDVTVWQGDALEQLALLPAESVQCIVTSPPYFGLRDYGMPGQIGLEPSPAAYVETLRAVFNEARRVLAKDGVMWLNLGDSYYSGRGNPGPNSADEKQEARRGWVRPVDRCGQDWAKPKALLGIPWRTAFALQDDGWTLRNDVIWAKVNAMPESVTDRLSSRHEHVFLFSRSRRYWFNLDAIREPLAYPDAADGTRVFGGSNKAAELTTGSSARRTGNVYGVRPQRARAEQIAREKGLTQAHLDAIRACGVTDVGQAVTLQTGAGKNRASVQALADEAKAALGGYYREFLTPGGKNPGDVWTITAQPFAGAHFATMPPELVRRCILAGCPEGGSVLDPFAGSGTTLMVARKLARRSVGIELNPDYVDIIRRRIGQEPLLFGEETA